MPALPTSPANQAPPSSSGSPPSPESQPPFGEPAGETVYTNAPSYEPPLPPDAAHPRRTGYLALAVLVVIVVVLSVLGLLGML